MQKNILSPYEQVRQAVATMAIEDMYVTDDMIEKGLQIADGKISVEDVIKELNKKIWQNVRKPPTKHSPGSGFRQRKAACTILKPGLYFALTGCP